MSPFTRLASAAAALVLGAVPAAAQAPAEAPAPQVSSVYTQMRQEALTIPHNQLDWDGRRRPRVWGVVMEAAQANGSVATLVVFADGTTSLYSSAGGGIVGAGPQRDVRRASDEMLQVAGGTEGDMAPPAADGTFPLPAAGRVRFYLRTNGGLRTAEAAEDELKAGSHALSGLYTAGQAVLSEVRPLSRYNP